MKTNVKCPSCNKSFPLDELVLNDFKNSIREEFNEELLRKEQLLTKQLDKARKEIHLQVQNDANLTIRTKEKLIADLKTQLAKAQQRLENSSQQMIGEIQELELEAILASHFKTDTVEPVPKGINGADCVLTARVNETQIGKILFESKRVSAFNEKWIDKLKKDNLKAKCDITVIVTSTLPKGMHGKFGIVQGCWICLFEPEAIKELCLVLRYGLLKVFESKKFHSASDEKAKELIGYLSSNEFHNQVESVLSGLRGLEQNFQEEKSRVTKLWAMRAQQLQDTLEHTLEVFDSIGAIVRPTNAVSETSSYRQAG